MAIGNGHYQDMLEGDNVFARITDKVARVAEASKPPRAWYIAFALASLLTLLFFGCIVYLVMTGVGVWGNRSPVFWGFDIINFVFWIGIGHAGTLMSAILYLFRQGWRTAINRFAEAMTLFAVVCAGIFPVIHLGRPWLSHWLLLMPNQRHLWPQFQSPLEWDVFAVGTYVIVSFLFWYVGMIPDLGTFRDRATSPIRRAIYAALAMGWHGSSRQWHRYGRIYLLLAALATPLVLSVHSIVSFDFATSQLPGWHTTISPPYFIVGAILSGLAMVVILSISARQFFGLEKLITIEHIEPINKIILAMSIMIGCVYGMECFMAWYSDNVYEEFAVLNRTLGPYAWAYWTMVACNVLVPQLFWSRRLRRHWWVSLVVGVVVSVGMWLERFVVIVVSLSRDFLPSSWGSYLPTKVDYLTLLGSFGLFFSLFLLFCRYLPMVAIAEVKAHTHASSMHHS